MVHLIADLMVAYLMPTEETRNREFGALNSVPDRFRFP